PESQTLLARACELNRHSLQHWGTDGNQGPAIAQAWQQFAAGTLFAAAVRSIAGVDLYELPVLRRSAEQLMAFTPPGAEQAATFGDAAETRDLYPRHAAALRLHAQQSREVSAIWYWQARPANISSPSDASVWQLLLLGTNPQALPTGSGTLANDWFSTQAGLAAMHSDIRSPNRSSVFFISSRHGAYGATQAEHNTLAYVSQGRPLLINAGSTPYVGSPHHRNTRATRFKNALTFDGGIGQAEAHATATRPGDPLFNMDPGGSLIHTLSAGQYAAVTGDATSAYRAVDTTRNTWTPLLSNAVRSVVVDKANGLTLVYDWATSARPRQWELNFHAPQPFISDAATVRSVNGPASVCLDRHGPATQFSQTAAWEVAPELPQAPPSRGRFSTLSRSTEFAHLTVLREGCRNVPLQVSQSGSQINLLINGKDALLFDRRSLTLPATATGSPPLVSIAAAALIAANAGLASPNATTASSATTGVAAAASAQAPGATGSATGTAETGRARLQQAIADMNTPHEVVPAGVAQHVGWKFKPTVAMNTEPYGHAIGSWWKGTRYPYWRGILTWFVIYAAEGGNPAKNTAVEINGIELWYLSTTTKTWRLVQANTTPVWTDAYAENAIDISHDRVFKRVNQAEASFAPSSKNIVHGGLGQATTPWTSRPDTADIDALYAVVKHRLVLKDPAGPDDRQISRLGVQAGVDYYPWVGARVADLGAGQYLPGAGVGRFIQATSGWRYSTFVARSKRITEAQLLAIPAPQLRY
ncbi:heparinase II/III family protein, partial [Roseateles sp.]|uniref:heparinase II/III domain-containing protein n=1 Tax=Roseateles sp. TaxID=1971397 RepID=UPI00391CA59B